MIWNETEGIIMPKFGDQQGGRFDRRVKRRKTNIILNTLIAIVILLIIVVASSIFFSKEDPNNDKGKLAASMEQEKSKKTQDEDKDKNKDIQREKESKQKEQKENKEERLKEEERVKEKKNDERNEREINKQKEKDKKKENNKEYKTEKELEKENEKELETNGDEIIEKAGTESNVEKEIVNESWKPVGTSQANGHVSSYDSASVDWQEKTAALSYATGISQDDMIIWYLQGGSDPSNEAIGTITTKDQSQTYRVYIEWVDSEGWKPVKVEELQENDKK